MLGHRSGMSEVTANIPYTGASKCVVGDIYRSYSIPFTVTIFGKLRMKTGVALESPDPYTDPGSAEATRIEDPTNTRDAFLDK